MVVHGLSMAVFIAATLVLLLRLHAMVALIGDDSPGQRMRRRLIRRGLLAMGLWQWSVALVLITFGHAIFPVALLLMGAYMVWGSRHLWAFGMMDR